MLQDVAEFTTTCERYVGTESGGMDQAISMMGMPQIAKLIEFNPVSCHWLCCPLHTSAVVLMPEEPYPVHTKCYVMTVAVDSALAFVHHMLHLLE